MLYIHAYVHIKLQAGIHYNYINTYVHIFAYVYRQWVPKMFYTVGSHTRLPTLGTTLNSESAIVVLCKEVVLFLRFPVFDILTLNLAVFVLCKEAVLF